MFFTVRTSITKSHAKENSRNKSVSLRKLSKSYKVARYSYNMTTNFNDSKSVFATRNINTCQVMRAPCGFVTIDFATTAQAKPRFHGIILCFKRFKLSSYLTSKRVSYELHAS